MIAELTMRAHRLYEIPGFELAEYVKLDADLIGPASNEIKGGIGANIEEAVREYVDDQHWLPAHLREPRGNT